MRHFVWCLPVAPAKPSETNLRVNEIASRAKDIPRGIVPEDGTLVMAAIDRGKYLAHWIVVAWSKGATGQVVDYGRLEVPSDGLGVEQAITITLKEAADMMTTGWPRGTPEG